MTTTTTLNIPICHVKDCGRFRQMYSSKSMTGGKNSYLKTCARHTYKDLNKK